MGLPTFPSYGNSSSGEEEEGEGENNNKNKNNNNNDNDDDDDDADDNNKDEDVEFEFVPPRSPLTQYSEYGQRKGKRTIYAMGKRPEIEKGKEVGWFNWGSAIVLVADLPVGYEPIVKPMEELRVGQALVAPNGKASSLKTIAED